MTVLLLLLRSAISCTVIAFWLATGCEQHVWRWSPALASLCCCHVSPSAVLLRVLQVIQAFVRQAMSYIDTLPDKETQVSLIKTLQTVTEGKVGSTGLAAPAAPAETDTIHHSSDFSCCSVAAPAAGEVTAVVYGISFCWNCANGFSSLASVPLKEQ